MCRPLPQAIHPWSAGLLHRALTILGIILLTLGGTPHPTAHAQLRSAAPTPASSWFPVPVVDSQNWQHLPVPSAQVRQVRGGTVQVVELRGWLRQIEDCNGKDPDWHCKLELDPSWADSQGISLDQIIKVGTINVMSDARIMNDPNIIVGRPLIHVELHVIRPTDRSHPRAPSDWRYLPNVGESCRDAIWPFDLRNPLPWQRPLREGDYVRMVGSLITDAPHEDQYAIQKKRYAAIPHLSGVVPGKRTRRHGKNCSASVPNGASASELDPSDSSPLESRGLRGGCSLEPVPGCFFGEGRRCPGGAWRPVGLGAGGQGSPGHGSKLHLARLFHWGRGGLDRGILSDIGPRAECRPAVPGDRHRQNLGRRRAAPKAARRHSSESAGDGLAGRHHV
jgi:hypothetical protein